MTPTPGKMTFVENTKFLTLEDWARMSFNQDRISQYRQSFIEEHDAWLKMIGPPYPRTWRRRLEDYRYRVGQKIVAFGEWVGG